MINFQEKKGFTLIETFVAITILMIVVIGPMSLLSQALMDARILRDKMLASYLSQEGVETILLLNNNSGPGFMRNLSLNSAYRVDPANQSPSQIITSCGGGCGFVLFDPEQGVYGYRSGDPTIFTREIYFSQPAGADLRERLIRSNVFWTDRYGRHEVDTFSYVTFK